MISIEHTETSTFVSINRGYDSLFHPNQLTVGLVAPIERYSTGPVPGLVNHIERVQLAESLGFSAVWLRDIPFNVPAFGDAGQLFDPFVYLGTLAGSTSSIALGVASLILPLRHPAHVAKAAASVDILSNGRLVLGIASGDRPDEYPAMNIAFADRGEAFRESVDYIRQMEGPSTIFANRYGSLTGTMDLLPKPVSRRLPLLITGRSQQDLDWIVLNGDGWMLYPRTAFEQKQIVRDWQRRVEEADLPPKPVMQPLHIDLADDPDTTASPIHLGYRLGANVLVDHLHALADAGVNHVALNLRFNQADTEPTLEQLAQDVLPHFIYKGT